MRIGWVPDRLFWVLLSRLWKGWRSSLHMVQPGTVVKWHRQGFKLFWRWKSRNGKTGRPKVDAEIRDSVRRMSRENALWGAPRILLELKMLGYAVAKSTVEKYMIRGMKPPSQTWLNCPGKRESGPEIAHFILEPLNRAEIRLSCAQGGP